MRFVFEDDDLHGSQGRAHPIVLVKKELDAAVERERRLNVQLKEEISSLQQMVSQS
jgi:hypothetical protein